MTKSPAETRRWRETKIENVTAINPETGEVIHLENLSGRVPITPKKKRRELKFMLVDIEAMPELKMSQGLWSLFWQVVKFTDKERGEARVMTKELAEALGWTSQNTSRALGRLRKRGILLRINQGVWMVNPRLMSRKGVEKWELDMEEAPQIDWRGDDDD